MGIAVTFQKDSTLLLNQTYNHMSEQFYYQSSPVIVLGTNKFIDVPVILKYEDTVLTEMVKEVDLGYTTEFTIYHNDGTGLAKVKGTRIYPIREGADPGIKVVKHADTWELLLADRTIIEVQHTADGAFRFFGELHTPDGNLLGLKVVPEMNINVTAGGIQFAGGMYADNIIQGAKVGIWIRSNGAISLGSNR